MSEIEKLYENANIEPIDTKYDPMGNMVFTADCIGNTWTREQYMKEIPVYPSFTAEKQLELIKWLIHLCKNGEGIKDSYITMEIINNAYRFYLINPNWVNSLHRVFSINENFEKMLAGFINNLWQDLSDTEKAEIKRILE